MQEFVGKAYHGIGVTHMEEENDDLAIAAFNSALERKTLSSSIFVTKYDLGTVLYRTGNEVKAIETWKGALLEKHNKADIQHVQIYSDIATALADSDNLGEALSYSKVYTESIQKMLADDLKYKAENDKVLFADIVREYDEFASPMPLLYQTWFQLLIVAFVALIIYSGTAIYFRSKSSRKVSEVMSKLQSEFQHLKID